MNFKPGDRIKNERDVFGVIRGSSFNSLDQEWEYVVLWDVGGVEETCSTHKADSCWSKQEVVSEDSHLNDSLRYALEPLAFDGRVLAEKMIKALSFDDFRGFPEIKTSCNHEWIWYNGFSEQYEFCKKCDIKRR